MTELKNNEYRSSISNESLDLLPRTTFTGKIHLVQNFEELNEAINYLKNQSILGFDTETRPSFKKGQVFPVALLQLSTTEHAFLFRLNQIGISPGLAKLLASPAIIKVGAAIRDDIKVLQRLTTFKPHGFIDLQTMAKEYGIENLSLKKLAGIVLGVRISKSQRLTNWDAAHLTEQQQQYAATDAWIAHEIYCKLKTLSPADFITTIDSAQSQQLQ